MYANYSTDETAAVADLFCSCGSLRQPTGSGLWRCRRSCGRPAARAEFAFTVTIPQNDQPARYVPEDAKFLPTTTANCPGCGHSEAEFKQQQIRSIDEPVTRLYRCTSCGHRWREDG